MHPILLEIPGLGLPIRSFGVMVVLGFLLASHLVTRWYLARSDDPERDAPGIQALPLWVMAGVVGGARAVYVLVEVLRQSETGKRYLAEPIEMLFVWEGGLVMYGGAFGAILGGWLCVRKYGLNFPHALDIGFVAGFFGLAVGRVGCLLVGDDHGSVVPAGSESLPFPITLRVPDLDWLQANPDSLFPRDLAGEVLWATQPWMTANGVVLGLIGMALLKRRAYPGQTVLRLLALYSIGRFTIEAFRGDKIRGLWWEGVLPGFDQGISTSQLVSTVLFVVCVSLLLKNRGRREEAAGTLAAAARQAAAS